MARPPSGSEQRHVTESELADLLTRSWSAERARAEADLCNIPAELAELSRRFVTLQRRLLAANQRLRVVTGSADEVAAAEMARLIQMEGVVRLDVGSYQLNVETRPICVEYAGRRFDLGRFRIVLDLTGEVRIESLDKLGPKPYWDHPHIQAGLPCLGNLREGVLKLIADYELGLAVQVLMDFLNTYDATTAYTPIEGWPERMMLDVAPDAWQKLWAWIYLAEGEVGGLGSIVEVPGGFRVVDCFLIDQRATDVDTELDPAAASQFLVEYVQQGRDPVELRLWWHSHAREGVFWSADDERTIDGFGGDYLVSLVGNQRGKVLARLDRYRPTRETIGWLDVKPVPASPHDDAQARMELTAHVQAVRRSTNKLWTDGELPLRHA